MQDHIDGAKAWAALLEKSAGPLMVPVVNLMTGPPPVERNGGIWRYVKNYMIHEEGAPAILAHAFHFLDFPMSDSAWNAWIEGDGGEPGLRGWLKSSCGDERPLLFMDSGGFQLMNGPAPDLSRFGTEATQRGIFGLQKQFRPDAAASLDIPIHPGLSEDEVRRRLRHTTTNAREFLRKRASGEADFFPYLCVHGTDFKTAQRFTRRQVEAAEKAGLEDGGFGVAVGSLVPIRNNTQVLIDIVAGVRAAIGKRRIPVHVFGVSGPLVPFLNELGVSSFDSSTYVQAGQNLRALQEFPWGQEAFLKLEEFKEQSPYAKMMLDGGLHEAKEILTARPYQEYEFNGQPVTKSSIYAMLAMHNWHVLKQGLARFNMEDEADRQRHLVESSRGTAAGRRLLAAMGRFNPGVRTLAIEMDISLPELGDEDIKYPRIQPSLTPDAFDVTRYDYEPVGDAALILPCSRVKPYGEARMQRRIRSKLEENGIRDAIEIVTLSGLYGPVPERYERSPQVLEYDFLLTPHHQRQIALVRRRMEAFIRLFGTGFTHMAAYLPPGPYRRAVTGLSSVEVMPLEASRGAFSRNASLDLLVESLSAHL